MARSAIWNWALLAAVMLAIWVQLAGDKPFKVTGMFLASGLAIGALYALGGIGMVVLYRASGVLNFSAGAAGTAGAMCAWQLGAWGVWPPLTWAVCLAVALAITLGYGRLIAPRLAWREPAIKAVATLGFALIILGFVSFIWIDDPRNLDLPTDQISVALLGLKFTATRLLAFGATIGIAFGIYIFLARTTVGLHMRAVASNRDLSTLLGIPIARIETIAWGISGLIAGFTGLMFANLIRLEPVVITFMVIPSVAAALAGRLNSLALVLVGGVSMGVIESLLTLSPTLKGARPIAPFVIAAVVLLWHQRGGRLTFGGKD